jgi:hypothetical protein
VETALRQLPNVESVRAEPTSGNVLIFFLNANGMTEDVLNAHLSPFQLVIGCYRTGILGQNHIARLQYPACKQAEPEKK